MTRGLLALAICLAVVAPACVTPLPSCAVGPPDSMSADLLRLANASRAGAGLAPVGWHPRLWCYAKQHADRLAAEGAFYHRDLYALLPHSGFTSLGEVIARDPSGWTAPGVHAAWLASATHRAVILTASFRAIGIGVTYRGGAVWIVADYGR